MQNILVIIAFKGTILFMLQEMNFTAKNLDFSVILRILVTIQYKLPARVRVQHQNSPVGYA